MFCPHNTSKGVNTRLYRQVLLIEGTTVSFDGTIIVLLILIATSYDIPGVEVYTQLKLQNHTLDNSYFNRLMCLQLIFEAVY